MTNTKSRFQLIEGNPPVMPHKCSCCGTHIGTFLDFGLDLEFYGTVYLCANCTREAAEQVGYVPDELSKDLKTHIQRITEQYMKLKLENGTLRDAMASLLTTVPRDDSSVDPLCVSVAESEPVSKGTSKAKSGSAKPADESGHSSVQSDVSVDKFIRDLDI